MMQIGVRNETHCQSEGLLHLCFFWSVVCIHQGIKKMLQLTKPLNVLDEVKTPSITQLAVKSFPPLTGWERLPG